jgi:hypothetical protein
MLAKIKCISITSRKETKILAVLHSYPGGFLYKNKQWLPQHASPANYPRRVPYIIIIFTGIKPA